MLQFSPTPCTAVLNLICHHSPLFQQQRPMILHNCWKASSQVRQLLPLVFRALLFPQFFPEIIYCIRPQFLIFSSVPSPNTWKWEFSISKLYNNIFRYSKSQNNLELIIVFYYLCIRSISYKALTNHSKLI